MGRLLCVLCVWCVCVVCCVCVVRVISFLLVYFFVGVATEREEADQLCEAACTMGRVLRVCCVCVVCVLCCVLCVCFHSFWCILL